MRDIEIFVLISVLIFLLGAVENFIARRWLAAWIDLALASIGAALLGIEFADRYAPTVKTLSIHSGWIA